MPFSSRLPRDFPVEAHSDKNRGLRCTMIPRLTAALSSRFRSSLSFSFFSTTAASISPSPAELRKMTVKQLVEVGQRIILMYCNFNAYRQAPTKDAISDNKVVIFSKSWCPYCKRVKSLFANAYPTEKPVVLE